ncbi:hypothetical protein [Pantanalinema sp. GBBB05]
MSNQTNDLVKEFAEEFAEIMGEDMPENWEDKEPVDSEEHDLF